MTRLTAPGRDPEATAIDVSRPPVGLGEWLLLALVLAAAVGFRCWRAGELAVAHFDEGVYASNLASEHLDPAYSYPDRHLYAPPLWPQTLELWQTVFGRGSTMGPGLMAGVLGVAVMWWAARCWYGPAGGLVAATLLALSDTHVLFSRTALTDVPTTLLMLAGVFAAWRALVTGSSAWTIAAGVASGLAWSVKYSGWLTLAVSGSAAAAWSLFERNHDGVRRLRPVRRWLMIAGVAVATWLPTWWSLQPTGGYGAVSDNHSQYFVGPLGWSASATTQMRLTDEAAASGTWWPLVGLVGFGALAVRPLGQSVAYFLAAVLGTRSPGLTWLVPVAGTAARSLRNMKAGAATPQPRRLATWMTLAWLAGLFFAVPLYTPYLRLTVPLVAAGCLMWADLASRGERSDLANRRHVSAGAALMLATFAAKAAGLAAGGSDGFYDRSAVRVAAGEIERAVADAADRSKQGAAVYVLGEPAVFFHLSALENDPTRPFLAQPAGNLGVLEASSTDARLDPFVVVGPHSRAQFPGVEDDPRLRLIGRFEATPDLVTRLDAEATAGDAAGGFALYEVQ